MTHRIGIDHRRKSYRSPRREEQTGQDRIERAYTPVSEATRRTLARDLRDVVDGEVRFDNGDRALYATDASNYRQVPLGVVLPRSVEGVVAAVELCHEARVPVLPRGAGTSLAGETCNVAVVIDCSKYLDGVLWLDADRRLAKVEPGCVLDTLRDAAEQHDLTFGPDPATHDHNTLGGMLGNNSCGVHSVMAGRTSDNVEALEILTYDGVRMTVGRTSPDELKENKEAGGRRGEIYRDLEAFIARYGALVRARFPKIPRRVSGYENLDELLPENGFNVARALVGTEGTCVTVLSATLNLCTSPPARALAVVGFKDIFEAADAVPSVLEFRPIGLEGIDDLLVDFIRKKHLDPNDARMLPSGGGWLVAEFGGETSDAATAAACQLVDHAKAEGWSVELIINEKHQTEIWELREAALAATAHVPDMPESWPGWEDSAVPREALGDYLRELKALLARHGYKASVYGHFGDGLVHCRIPFDLRTEAGIANWQHFLDEAADLVVRHGGSLSGEHGDGQARAQLLERMYGAELIQAFREFKAIWDPDGRMNPGKVVDPYPVTSNLRVGPRYNPRPVEAAFAYPEDGGSFVAATQRCVGVGACRRTDSAKSVMCPSYMVTREEKHSTRGRARLLFEMLHGGAIIDGWRSRAVEEALDLCLACKGCKSDCPVHVDMATYKAEFRARYYAGRFRPRSAYAMGQIQRWSRLAGRVPWLANGVLQAPIIGAAAKWAGGIAQARSLPRYAARSFTRWFHDPERRKSSAARVAGTAQRDVVLWPDTFNNFFRVDTAIAATVALERLGYRVSVPHQPVCCGRPLYDWGWLEEARALWRTSFQVLEEPICNGTPIVGLEPACVSAFRDELPSLFPDDKRARALSRNAKLLSEFLDGELPDLGNVGQKRRGLLHLHCHHHAVLDGEAEARVAERIGLEPDVLKAGCCGMAGAFGFEADKYDVSVAAAERVLLPRLREAPDDIVVLADGFSCREQIEQGCGRRTWHLAEVLAQHLVATGGSA